MFGSNISIFIIDSESMGRIKCRMNTGVAHMFILENHLTTKKASETIQFASKWRYVCRLPINQIPGWL